MNDQHPTSSAIASPHSDAISNTDPVAQSAQGSTPGLGVLEKAMGILNLVSASSAPMTFSAMLRVGNLPKATLHRILATLVREGLLRYDAYLKTYHLGFRLLELAHEVWSNFDIRLAAKDVMTKLRTELKKSVYLAVLDSDSLVVAATEHHDRNFSAAESTGTRWPLNKIAAGKSVLAYMDTAAQLAYIEKLGLQDLETNRLKQELDICRARGYSLQFNEEGSVVLSVAAPVFDIESRPVAALAVDLRGFDITPSKAHQISSTLIAAARSITHNAGGKNISININAMPNEIFNVEVNCVYESKALLGEGPIWSPRDGALYWVDILTPSVFRLDGVSMACTESKLATMASIVIPTLSGGLLFASPNGLMLHNPSTQVNTLLCHPESERPTHRYNDGKCDRRGRLWVGSMDMGAEANRGCLYKVTGDGAWTKMDSGFTVPNGMGWSPDNKLMYMTDSTRKVIYVYDFDLDKGAISNKRNFVTFSPDDGVPDGLTVDAEGYLWVAVWNSWRLSRFSPDGIEVLRVLVPVPRPSSCCFGGNNLETLYITSASVRLTEQELRDAPLSGSLFSLQMPGVRGLPESTFAH